MVSGWLRDKFTVEEPVTTGDVFRALLEMGYHANPQRNIDDPFVAQTYRLGESRLAAPTRQTSENSFRQVARYGWLWFAGTVDFDGVKRTYCLPAISFVMTVSLDDSTTQSHRQRVTNPQVTELVSDPVVRRELLQRAIDSDWIKPLWSKVRRWASFPKPLSADQWAEHPDLSQWIADVAAAIGLEIDEVRQDSPVEHRDKSGITLHIGTANYAVGAKPRQRKAYSLDDLEELPNFAGTAFSTLYGGGALPASEGRRLVAFRPLSLRQRQIAGRVAGNDLAVISGAPGTGKSHVLSVVAADAVARGESVLVVVNTPQAVDVLVEHFAKTPGPPSITFGGSRFGQQLNRELIDLSLMIEDDDETDEALLKAAHTHDERAKSLRRMLSAALAAERIEVDDDYRAKVSSDLARAGDLVEVAELVEKVLDGGLALVRRQLGKRLDDLDDPEADLERLYHYELAWQILDDRNLSLVDRFDEMAANELDAAKIGGEVLSDHWISGLGRKDKKILTELATAVVAERQARKVAFSQLDPRALTKAAPLWVGALDDVDDVLPAVAGMFDLVIMDEAAHVDQMQAAHVLVRAKRALFFGDREQITHTSSLTEENVAEVARQHRLDSSKFNPKEMSVFDAAIARVPSEALDEHFRSAPHLIEFSSRRFYQGGLHTVTRNPHNEAADHIHLAQVEGVRDPTGVNQAEVDECMRLVEQYIAQGWTSIGLVSPRRAQVEALRAAMGDRLDEMATEEIRIGDARQFQGDERDIMIISYGIGANESASAWDEVNDPNTFNVMVTRAREHAVIITSDPAPPGLAGEYVLWSEPLVDLVRDEEILDPWVHQVADVLRSSGIPVRTGYRSGRYIIDLVAGTGEQAVAIDCVFHADGREAHIDRAMTLRRTGWRTADAFELKWRYRLEEYAGELRTRFPDLA